jgi:hypothetical protein
MSVTPVRAEEIANELKRKKHELIMGLIHIKKTSCSIALYDLFTFLRSATFQFTFEVPWVGIFNHSMGGYRNRVGKGLLYRPDRLHRLAELESVPGLLQSLKIRALESWRPIPYHSPPPPPPSPRLMGQCEESACSLYGQQKCEPTLYIIIHISLLIFPNCVGQFAGLFWP